MSAFDTEDLKTEINTIINKSGELMDTANASPEPNTPRKSILKIPTSSFVEKNKVNNDFLNHSSHSDWIPRPLTLEDFVKNEALSEQSDSKSTFTFEELNENEELWVMDIPGTIDPLQLKGQTLQLGDKSKFKVKEDRYCAINKDSKTSLTCVFNTDDESRVYKTVNIKPAGSICIRRKLSGISKKKVKFETTGGVPFPKNVKLRHPFFGVQVDESVVKIEKTADS